VAWTFVGVSNVVEVTATAHALVTTGITGLAAGDLLVACISSRIASTTSVTLPAGWTLVSEQKNNNILTTSSALPSGLMAYCIRGASDPALTFTHPAAPAPAIGRIVAYRGGSGLDTQSSFTTAIATTPVSGAGVTTSRDGDLIIAMAAGGQEAAWSSFNATSPSGASGATSTAAPTTAWLERADSQTTTGNDTSLGIFDAVKTTAGATGNLTTTASVSAGHVVVAGAFKAVLNAWNSADKSTNMVLSNADMAATSSTATPGGARSITKRQNGAAGKYYAEYRINVATGANSRCGISPISSSLPASTTGIFGVVLSSGSIIVGGSGVSNVGASLTAADVLCVAWDSGAKLIWFRKNNGLWNNDASANPATGTNGITATGVDNGDHALWMLSNAAADSITIRTELAELTQSPLPSGFTDWMGTALPATAKSIAADAASYALTGTTTAAVLLKRKIDATTAGSYSYTGTDVAIAKGVPPKRLTADAGSYLLTGAATTTILRRARIDATTGSSYSLTGASTTTVLHKAKIDATVGGAYALTGASTTSLLHKYRPAALGGSYLLTGTDAALTKTAALVNKTLPAGTASYALTGTDAAIIKRVFKRLTADGASYAVTGAATSAVLVKRKLTADAGTYALTGAAATPWHGYKVIAGASSYALTGNATAVLLHRWKVAATGGTYALSGNSATFLIHKDIVSAAPGAYALTGAAVNFQIRSDKFVSAASGVYALTGTPVSVRKTWKHAATAGSYALTGADAALTKLSQRTLAAGSGSYSLSGTAASVLHRWKTAALGSSYALTGSPATVVHRFKVAAATASYALTGTAATVTKVAARTVTAASGAYALTGAPAAALHRAKLPAVAGIYALTGSPATVRYGYKVPAGASSYAMTGTAALFPRTRRLTADPLIGRYQVTGGLLTRVLYNWTFPTAGSSYAITGTPATLRRVRTITAAPASYALTGKPAIVNKVGLLYLVADTASYEITGNVARIFGGDWTISDRTVLAVAEDRRVAVAAETRSVKATAEIRLVRVPAELRTVSAPEEFRTIQARGENHGVSTMATQGPRRGPRLQHRLVTPAD
jgi:hypothetical protein